MAGGILSLDLGRMTGWGVANRSAISAWPAGRFLLGRTPQRPAILCGTFTIGPTGLPHGEYYDIFEKWLDDMLTVHAPDAVVFEAAIPHHGGQEAARRAFGKISHVEKLCHRRRVKAVREVANNTVKKAFTGNGRAEKPAMIAACHDRGWNPPDHNAADGCAILECGVRVLKHRETL
ncbi:hypothetical protein ACW7BJ_27730 [Azospirillum argentinense]